MGETKDRPEWIPAGQISDKVEVPRLVKNTQILGACRPRIEA